MHPKKVDSPRMRRYPVLVACCTFALVVAGGLVTSKDAARSIPDWPLNWGRLIPPLEANIRYEFAHRVLALIVLLMIGGLAWRERTKLAWTAFAAVLAQALLGGVVVKFVTPAAATIAHAALAQLCFGLTVAVAVSAPNRGLTTASQGAPAPEALTTFPSPRGRSRLSPVCPVEPASVAFSSPVERPERLTLNPAPPAAATAVFAQTILGAAVRHNVIGPLPHIAGAAIATVLVMWAGLSTLMSHEDTLLRRRAIGLLGHTFFQVFLGIAAYAARAAAASAPQPVPLTVWITVAHVAVGSLVFGSAVALMMATQTRRPAFLCAVTSN
jgi:cytochrome c oxidase assembly protein subunit 15